MFGLKLKNSVPRAANFSGWTTKVHNSRFNLNKYNQVRSSMLMEFLKLTSPTHRLLAAYSSFDSELKALCKDELNSLRLNLKVDYLIEACLLFDQDGLKGCSHLLCEDYAKEFAYCGFKPYEPIPSNWIKDEVDDSEVEISYINDLGRSPENHFLEPIVYNQKRYDWGRLLFLSSNERPFRSFDSGFCKGFAVIENGGAIAHVVLCQYSRR